jgi:hypothetical protein
MLRMYDIDGQDVIVAWVPRCHPRPAQSGWPESLWPALWRKTALGRFLASDDHRRSLGTFVGLREAVEQVVRATHRSREARRLRGGPDGVARRDVGTRRKIVCGDHGGERTAAGTTRAGIRPHPLLMPTGKALAARAAGRAPQRGMQR